MLSTGLAGFGPMRDMRKETADALRNALVEVLPPGQDASIDSLIWALEAFVSVRLGVVQNG